MQWIYDIFMTHSALQAVIIISVIIAVGLAFGKIRVWGISLGFACGKQRRGVSVYGSLGAGWIINPFKQAWRSGLPDAVCVLGGTGEKVR